VEEINIVFIKRGLFLDWNDFQSITFNIVWGCSKMLKYYKLLLNKICNRGIKSIDYLNNTSIVTLFYFLKAILIAMYIMFDIYTNG
jgi:hypothetical protein